MLITPSSTFYNDEYHITTHWTQPVALAQQQSQRTLRGLRDVAVQRLRVLRA